MLERNRTVVAVRSFACMIKFEIVVIIAFEIVRNVIILRIIGWSQIESRIWRIIIYKRIDVSSYMERDIFGYIIQY